MRNINLSEYKLVKPESIEKIEGDVKRFIDIEVEDDHTFFINGENNLILSHNCDGNSIVGLLLNFFYKYWPDIFERKMIYKVETPIVVAIPKAKNKAKIFFYSQIEYNKWLEKSDHRLFEIKYKKGLGALIDDEYKMIIQEPRMTLITKDDFSEKSLGVWFGDDSSLRKEQILL